MEQENTPQFAKYRQRFADVQQALSDNGRFTCEWNDRWPCLYDAFSITSSHYTFPTAWAARILAQNMPEKHVDIGSPLYFSTLVSAFVPVEQYDLRPYEIDMPDLRTRRVDITDLPFLDDSIKSLSCIHVVEDVGLERYGDQFNPQGDMKAMAELSRVLAPNGTLMLVCNVSGTPRIAYNAGRYLSYRIVMEAMHSLCLVNFALITDDGSFLPNAHPDIIDQQRCGVGCWRFTK